MEPLKFKPYVNRVILMAVVALVVFKTLLRPWVKQNDLHEAFLIFLNSLPNFLEVLVGVPVLASGLLILRHRQFKMLKKLSERIIYFISTVLAAVYVITQELKIHNIGGNNVYDANDLVASVFGLLFMLVLMLRYGFADAQSPESQGFQK